MSSSQLCVCVSVCLCVRFSSCLTAFDKPPSQSIVAFVMEVLARSHLLVSSFTAKMLRKVNKSNQSTREKHLGDTLLTDFCTDQPADFAVGLHNYSTFNRNRNMAYTKSEL